ncbi:hypothetical protein PISMIDRAFT_15409 [Pisolithus microcarpus 441]|uniref:Uncharacterized protein n=1 Tax=Pisolithus microcarpus 441 TaxID=765257 RepID=A0A0C9XX78_9AGAM|nr:hypothetical protein PISMIDRAFT_15409 [Pisolithus microcarpus 441]
MTESTKYAPVFHIQDHTIRFAPPYGDEVTTIAWVSLILACEIRSVSSAFHTLATTRISHSYPLSWLVEATNYGLQSHT